MSIILKLLASLRDQVRDIHPTDRDAFRLIPNNISPDSLMRIVRPMLKQEHWLATAIVRGGVLIEPHYTSKATIDPCEALFHVSDGQNRESIRSGGLKLHSGGNTSMNRSYPPRIFFSTTLPATFKFIDFQCRAKRNPFTRELEHEPKKREDLDVWKICPRSNIEWFRDVLFPGEGVWCENEFPANELQLYENWRLKEDEWHQLRRRGEF
jgi:hypothetical protein